MPVFEAGMLPDSQKEDLCRTLLEEFGVGHINRRDDELIHGCLLPRSNHTDQQRNPTAALNWKKLTYKCLGCGSGGGLLWFIATCRGGSTVEARSWLEGATGTGNALMGLTELLKFFDAIYAQKASTHEPIPTYSPRVLAPWEWLHPYMTEVRGVPEQTVLDMKVGYAEAYEIQREPNVVTSERVVIPHFWKGNLVGWQTRRIFDDGTPKYLSSPAFPREQTIYDYDPSRRHAVVVESPFSTLRHRHHHHMPATFGASVTTTQIRLLQKYGEITFWMDNDDAGWKSLLDTIDRRGRVEKQGLLSALSGSAKCYVVPSFWAADPADMDDDTVDSLIAERIPWSIWNPPSELRQWQEVNA